MYSDALVCKYGRGKYPEETQKLLFFQNEGPLSVDAHLAEQSEHSCSVIFAVAKVES